MAKIQKKETKDLRSTDRNGGNIGDHSEHGVAKTPSELDYEEALLQDEVIKPFMSLYFIDSRFADLKYIVCFVFQEISRDPVFAVISRQGEMHENADDAHSILNEVS